jgi:hypothetical protein
MEQALPSAAAHPIELRPVLRGVAYRFQERIYGGLSLSSKRPLQTLARDFDRRKGTGTAPTQAQGRAAIDRASLGSEKLLGIALAAERVLGTATERLGTPPPLL